MVGTDSGKLKLYTDVCLSFSPSIVARSKTFDVRRGKINNLKTIKKRKEKMTFSLA